MANKTITAMLMSALTAAASCSDSNFSSGTTQEARKQAPQAAPTSDDGQGVSLPPSAAPAVASPAIPAEAEPSLTAAARSYQVSKNAGRDISLTATLSGSQEPISYEIIEGPQKGVIESFDAVSGKLVYRAEADRFGEDTIRFKALAGGLESEAVIKMAILNVAPSVAKLVVSSAKNSPATVKVSVADPDQDTIALTLSKASDLVESHAFDSATGTLSIVPKPDFVGTIDFEVVASDGESSSPAGTISFVFTNAAPEGKDLSVSTIKDSPIAISLAGTDADAVDAISFAIKESPANGLIDSFDPTRGTLVFIPAANYVGEASFTYSVSDASKSGEGTVHINVRNEAPLANNITASVNKNATAPIRISLGSYAADPDGHSLSYKLIETPKGGAFTIDHSNGELTYLPKADFYGADTFSYAAFDGAAYSSPGMISVQVVNAPPAFVSTPITNLKYYLNSEDTVIMQATVRDFRPYPKFHVDFQNPKFQKGLPTYGLVQSQLGADGKPVLADLSGALITSPDTFAQWYQDVPGVNMRVNVNLELKKNNGVFAGGSSQYFPINGQGFANADVGDPTCNGRNCHFTVEFETTFKYEGNEEFTFLGDDDLWVFINNKLAVDIGGVHTPATASIKLKERAADLGLVVGQEYPFKLFQAERFAGGSGFQIQTSLNLRSNLAYAYKAAALDPEGDVVTYSLLDAPAGMIIDPVSGALAWTPRPDQLGGSVVSIQAKDSAGATAIQKFTVVVE